MAGNDKWPHLLLEQGSDYTYQIKSEEEKQKYHLAPNKLVLSMDIRLTDYTPTTNSAGINAAEFLAYLYASGIETNDFIWFGFRIFDSRGPQGPYWNLDAGSNCMIYSISTADVFGSEEKSLFRNGKPRVSEEWTHIRIDLTPHIEAMIEAANRDNIFGRTVTAEDFYISGTNIGWEIHGNYDCTMEIKNYTVTAY